MVTFPTGLAPSFFEIGELPSYGLKIVENEIGREIRRFTETTGHNTRLSLRYSGMTSIEVSQLIGFYQSVKGTFEAFTLPSSFYLNPDDYNIALAILGDTTNWRFESPPRIDTIISDLYTTEFTLISLKEEENLNLDTFFGITQRVNLALNVRKVSYEGKDDRDTQSNNLYLDTSTLETIEIEEISLLSLAFNLGKIDITSSRGLKNLILLNSFNFFTASTIAQTGGTGLSLNFLSFFVSKLDSTSIIPTSYGYTMGVSRAVIIRGISPAVFRFAPNDNLPDESDQGETCSLAVRGYWAEEQFAADITFGSMGNTNNAEVILKSSNILMADINLGLVRSTNNLQKYKGVTRLL
jgi:hypothetical protein